MPQVSIVLPAYNHEAFIAEAIDSVLAQTFSDFELIVIDDGSSDRTADIVATYTDSRLQLIRQSNVGSHATINRGIAMAGGHYVAILNSDDRYAPERLARLVALADARPGPTFAVSAVRLIDGNGHPIDDPQHWWRRMYAEIHQHWEDTRDPAEALMWGNFTVSTSNFFFSRSLFQQLGPLRHYRYVLDWEYALRAASSLPDCFVYLDQDLLLDYRLHGNNTILGGTIRNHVEASHIVRSALQRLNGGNLRTPLWRLYYLLRFLRRKEVANREHQLKLMTSEKEHIRLYKETLEQERSALQATLANSEKLRFSLTVELADRNKELREQKQAITQIEQSVIGLTREQQATVEAFNHLRVDLRVSEQERHRLFNELQHLNYTLNAMQSSTSWHLTAPLRWTRRQQLRIRNGLQALRRLRQQQGLSRVLPHAFGLLLREGPAGIRRLLRNAVIVSPSVPVLGNESMTEQDIYSRWIVEQAERIEFMRTKLPETLTGFPSRPVFSVTISNPDVTDTIFREMLDTVQQQFYPFWELCLADPSLLSASQQQLLIERASTDPRIKSDGQPSNGSFVLLLNAGDKLMPHALLSFAQHLAYHHDAEVIYSDEDKFDRLGQRQQPLFKPDWSPMLACIQNYVGHALCIKRSLFATCGGIGRNIDGANGYDLVLRLSEHTQPQHLPDVLYHQRLVVASQDNSSYLGQAMHDAGKQAVAQHLARRYPQQFLRVDDGDYLYTYDPRFVAKPTKVSIIIPTKDKIDLLSVCLDSILQKTRWPDYEILVLDNNSNEAESFAYFDKIGQQHARVRVIPAPYKFNWSFLNNFGVRHATGDVFVFLNNDTELISPDWLDRLVETTMLPDVATVGAQLFYEDGTLQHVGVVVGMGGWADHVYKGTELANKPSPFIANALTRNVLASTGACVAIERSKFEQLGGFDEAFEICGSDVELGIRAHKHGWQNIYLAPVKLRHFESKTRGPEVPEVDFIQSDMKYAPYRLGGDPFYNPNLAPFRSTPEPAVGGAA